MEIVGHLVVVVEIRKDQNGQIETAVEKRKLGFLQLPAALLHLQFRLNDVGMSNFPTVFEILGELEEALAFVCSFLRGLELLLRSRNGVIAPNHGHDQAARSN